MTSRWMVVAAASCVVLDAGSVRAGAIDNKTNLSADFARNPSRNALTSTVDAVAFNPAGVAFLPEGGYLSLSNQTLKADFAHEVAGREFASNNTIPVLPALYAAYRQDRWAVFAGLNIPAGGGTLSYPDGSVTTLGIALLAEEKTGLPIELSADLASVTYGAVLGGAYALTDQLSLSLAGRFVHGTRSVEMSTETGDYLTLLRASVLATQEESADGIGAIVSLHYRPIEALDFSLRYESQVNLQWTVDTGEINEIALSLMSAEARAGLSKTLPPEGSEYRHDLPGYLALGAAYRVMPSLQLSWSGNYYLQTSVDWNGGEDDIRNGWESSLGAEVSVTEDLLLSLGVIYTETGAKPRSYTIENPATDSVSVGFGGMYAFTDQLRVTVGLLGAFYKEDKAPHPSFGTIDITQKRVLVGALGVEWKFLGGAERLAVEEQS